MPDLVRWWSADGLERITPDLPDRAEDWEYVTVPEWVVRANMEEWYPGTIPSPYASATSSTGNYTISYSGGTGSYTIPASYTWTTAATNVVDDVRQVRRWIEEALPSEGEANEDLHRRYQERLREQERVSREQAEIRREAQRERRERRERAEVRAREVLDMFLDNDQLVCLNDNGYFAVEAEDGCVYKIYRGRTGNIRCVSGRYANREFCIHPVRDFPSHDQMLIQKAMIEGNYQEFLRVANF